MKIYIVLHEFDYEGSHYEGAFSDVDLAIRYAINQMKLCGLSEISECQVWVVSIDNPTEKEMIYSTFNQTM